MGGDSPGDQLVADEKEVRNPEHTLDRLTLKLKLQYFGHLMQRAALKKT